MQVHGIPTFTPVMTGLCGIITTVSFTADNSSYRCGCVSHHMLGKVARNVINNFVLLHCTKATVTNPREAGYSKEVNKREDLFPYY